MCIKVTISNRSLTITTPKAFVIGAGPAGLMAAQMLAEQGVQVVVFEAKPSPARKFLMAGKSGLNLTKNEPFSDFLSQYTEAAPVLKPMLSAFDSNAVQAWAQSLGQAVFTGSSGRVFPEVMKGSPLLRAWLAQLASLGVEIRRHWRWCGFDGDAYRFHTPEGTVVLKADVSVLALGGASWSRLGSDGQWAAYLRERGVSLVPFAAANVGLQLEWSQHMQKHFGQPMKNVGLRAGAHHSRGDFVVSRSGLEGSGIYSMSKPLREGYPLELDLFPDLSLAAVQQRLSRPKGKASTSNHLRKCLGLEGVRLALVQELAKPLVLDASLSATLKGLRIPFQRLNPIDQAISTAGGVSLDAVDEHLMLNAIPSVYCAGEMLGWEAPTGGYLLTACLATGRWAGLAAGRYAQNALAGVSVESAG